MNRAEVKTELELGSLEFVLVRTHIEYYMRSSLASLNIFSVLGLLTN